MSTSRRKASSKRLAITAFHEAGHCVAAYTFKHRIIYATIEPDRYQSLLGCVEMTVPRPLRRARMAALFQTEAVTKGMRDQLERDCITSFAGPVAEERYRGRLAVLTDDTEVFEFLLALSSNMQETSAYANWLYARAQTIIDNHWLTVTEVSKALLKERRLNGPIIEQIITNTIGLPDSQ